MTGAEDRGRLGRLLRAGRPRSGSDMIGGSLRRMLIGLPFLWLMVFLLLPVAIVAAISFAESADSVPPFAPLVSTGPAGIETHLTTANYRELAGIGPRIYANSLGNAALAAALCLLFGYPVALAIARAPVSRRNLYLFLIMLPFWTSSLIRVYAWIALLQPSGLINRLLIGAGLAEMPLPLLYNRFSVELGLVYTYLPFMILPLYGSLSRLDESLIEAAADLGARPWRILWSVILPLTLPGIAAGVLLVFIPAVGEFVIPDLLGGPSTLMIGKVLWQAFFDNVDWPQAAAIAIAMLGALTIPLLVAQQLFARRGEM